MVCIGLARFLNNGPVDYLRPNGAGMKVCRSIVLPDGELGSIKKPRWAEVGFLLRRLNPSGGRRHRYISSSKQCCTVSNLK